MWRLKCIPPKILMVNGTEIGGLVLCLKCVYVCVLLLHFVEESRHKCVDICSVRLTGIVFARGLSLRASAPSSYSVCEYLKEVNKGAPSRPFAVRRSSQLARNTKVTENCTIISNELGFYEDPKCHNAID